MLPERSSLAQVNNQTVESQTDKYHGVGGAIDWLGETVANPLINAAVIEPYNTVSNALQDTTGNKLGLGEIKPLETNQSKTYSPSWFVESAMSGIGSLVPYVVAGEATGGVMRGTGTMIGAEGTTAAVLANEQLAQLAGAGIYAGMKRPEVGETRVGNALSTVAGFAVFEAGNSLTASAALSKPGLLPLLARSGARLGTGLVGGAAQAELTSILGQHKLANTNQVIQSAVQGGFLNTGLGAAQDIAGGAVDSINSKLERGVPVSRYARLNDLNGRSNELDGLVKDNPLTRVQQLQNTDASPENISAPSNSGASADHNSNIVRLSAVDGGSKLAHELAHLKTAQSTESATGFEQAGRLLDQGRTEGAWQLYRQTRLNQEVTARASENLTAKQLGNHGNGGKEGKEGKEGNDDAQVTTDPSQIASLKTATGETYEQNWKNEFEQFSKDSHTFRPLVDFADATSKSADKSNVAYIVVDSGFDPSSLPPQDQIMGVWDLTGQGAFNDPLHHGSVVLDKLKTGDPNAKFMLIRAFDGDNNLMQTHFENGQVVQKGWSDAYLEAVALADKMHIPSVANCSFGEFTHAMDGTGWESFQLSHAIGDGKSGHAVVAASGAGNGAARHASGIVHTDGSAEVSVYQKGDAAFNVWMSKDAPKDWTLSVYNGGQQVYGVDGSQIGNNLWNDRQQVTFHSPNAGESKVVLNRTGADPRPLAFDYWVQDGPASFLDHVNSEMISEPAVFPDVVAVGVKDLSYSPLQAEANHKPDVLVPGDGPVSFRTPEVTLAVGNLLKKNPGLDSTQIHQMLGKYPLGQNQ